jgi:hypothetical protein
VRNCEFCAGSLVTTAAYRFCAVQATGAGEGVGDTAGVGDELLEPPHAASSRRTTIAGAITNRIALIVTSVAGSV